MKIEPRALAALENIDNSITRLATVAQDPNAFSSGHFQPLSSKTRRGEQERVSGFCRSAFVNCELSIQHVHSG